MTAATAAASSKKANAGPSYYDLIKEAVNALKERQGSSRHAIDKYVAEKKGAGYQKARLNMALKHAVETGKLVAVKGSFKLAAEEKKSAPKKPVVAVAKKEVKAGASASKPKKKSAPAKPKAASAATKKAGAKKAAPAKKVAKSSKKVSGKKPTTMKKKVVKKSAAKKSVAKKA